MRGQKALESFGERCAKAGPYHVGNRMPWGEDLPFAIPLSRSFFEQLIDGGADVVLGIKPWKFLVRVERRSPHEAAVILVLHAKQGKVEAGEVVVVNAAVDKGCGQANLSDVLLDSELWCPQGERSPFPAKYGVVGHA